jgi:serine/threonine-protein phosphatase CPPED1
MRRIATSLMVALVLAAVAAFSVTGAPQSKTARDLDVDVQDRNPWTHLELNNRPADFQFAIVTDRTGGRRPGVFTRAVEKINLLQPQFVMSVGDLIEGYTDDPGMWAIEWSEFESAVDRLQMPFFFCVGNHDISNVPMSEDWQRKFGRSYYHFRYHDVLFLVLNSEDPPATRERPYSFGPEQQEWAARVLADNADARWTFVFLHKPTWTYPDADPVALGWTAIEDALGDRRYTVFAGHRHQYGRFVRRGREYIMLATTGGSSNLAGLEQGRFDHVTWVTMKDDAPVIANILLDGIEPSDVRTLPDPMP